MCCDVHVYFEEEGYKKMPSEFGEGERETKDCAVKSGKTFFSWQDLSKFNERHNAYVAVRGKVSLNIQ